MATNNQSVVNISCLTLNQYTLKPFVYLSLKQKKGVIIFDYSFVAGIGLEPMTFGL
jgi:hypothetical protein